MQWRDEDVLVAFLLGMWGVFVVGGRINARLAADIRLVVERRVEEEFTMKLEVRKLGFDTYALYTTGRKGYKGFMVLLELKSRQDMLYPLWWLFSYKPYDYLSIDIPVEKESIGFFMAVIRKDQIEYRKSQHPDLIVFGKPVPMLNFPKNLICLVNSSDVLVKLFPSEIEAMILKLQDSIEQIHFSDYNTLSNISKTNIPKSALRFKFRLVNNVKIDEILDLVLSFMDLVEK